MELTHGVGSEIARVEAKLDAEAARRLVNNEKETLTEMTSKINVIETTALKVGPPYLTVNDQAVVDGLGFFIVNVIYPKPLEDNLPAGSPKGAGLPSFTVKQWDHDPHSAFDNKIVFAHHLNESRTFDATMKDVVARETDGTWATGGVQVASAEIYWNRLVNPTDEKATSTHVGWILSFLTKDAADELAVYSRYITRSSASVVTTGHRFKIQVDWDIVRFPLG